MAARIRFATLSPKCCRAISAANIAIDSQPFFITMWTGRFYTAAVPPQHWGGGRSVDPINIYLAGRATAKVGSEALPVEEIAVEGSPAWLRANLHALDAARHAVIHPMIRPGSTNLRDLFARRSKSGVALANDTAIGAAHAPLSPLERLVLVLERRINGKERNLKRPAWGEDVKS